MDELPDHELHKTTDEWSPEIPSQTRPVGVWVIAAVLMVAVGVAAYFAFARRPRLGQVASSAPTAPARAAPRSLGGDPDAITIPPLDASDPVVRTLVRALSERPAVTAWLATNGLIRNFTVVVTNIADGPTPAKHLSVLRPPMAFRVVTRDGKTFVDPRSYGRYAPIADAVASVDPAAAAKLYSTLKPRIEEAHRELGSPDQFDRTLERAIVALLETPAVDAPVRSSSKGIGYAYADERLESLTAAQKQLLRMGPRNVGIIKAKLREIALALGIPSTQLPAP